MTPRQAARVNSGKLKATVDPGANLHLQRICVLNLNSALDYNPFLNWMKNWLTVGIAKLSHCPLNLDHLLSVEGIHAMLEVSAIMAGRVILISLQASSGADAHKDLKDSTVR